jgi:hypothetical protein
MGNLSPLLRALRSTDYLFLAEHGVTPEQWQNSRIAQGLAPGLATRTTRNEANRLRAEPKPDAFAQLLVAINRAD